MGKELSIYGSGGGGGSGSRTPREEPNTLRSRNTARIVDIVSEGEIEGLVNGARSIFLDDTVIQNADGTFNFDGFAFEERVGTPNQSPVPGFARVESEIGVGVEVTIDNPVTRTITNPEADAVRIKVQIPALALSKDNGDRVGTQVEIRILIAEDGGSFIEERRNIISGKTVSPYERSYRIELPAGGSPWSVRVERITPDSTSDTLRNQTFFQSYTEVIDSRLIYPDSALLAISVDSALFGESIPRRTYRIRGRRLQVPINYDPINRTYDGIWNGEFKIAYSNNPAWVLFDIITNDRYGLGAVLPEAINNRFALFEIAMYCDEFVDDGAGGLEPRYTFNAVLNKREEAYAVLSTFASAFRTMTYWGSGIVDYTQDKPESSSRIITNANVINGEFTYTTASQLKDKKSLALVTWSDPNDNFRPAVAVIENNQLIDQLGHINLDVSQFGCTSEGQATRYGRALLEEQEAEDEVVEFQVSFDNADLRPGRVIEIADQFYANERLGGRVFAWSSNSITFDAPVDFDSTIVYQLKLVDETGILEERTISGLQGDHTIVTFQEPLANRLVDNAIWILVATGGAPRQFRVRSVREAETHLYSITGRFYDANKYQRIEDGVFLEIPDFSLQPVGPLPVLSNLMAEETLLSDGPITTSRVTFSFTPPDDPRVRFFEYEIRRPGEQEFEPLRVTTSTTIDILDIEVGLNIFRVRCLDGLNGRGPFSEFQFQALQFDAPPQVQGVRLATLFTGTSFTIMWNLLNEAEDYWVSLREVGSQTDLLTLTTVELSASFNFNEVRAVGLGRELDVAVFAINTARRLSQSAIPLTIKNEQSRAITIEVDDVVEQVLVRITPAIEVDNVGYRIHVDTSPGFQPTSANLVEPNATALIYGFAGEPNIDYFFQVAPFDVWGNTDELNFSNEASASVGFVTETLIEDDAISTPKLRANAVTAAKISVSQLSAITADIGDVTSGTFRTNTTTGFRAEMSSIGDFPLWYGAGAKTAANARFSVDRFGNLITNNMQANNIIARGDIEATSLQVGAAIVGTLNLEGQAVTIPQGIYIQGTIVANNNWQNIATLNFTTTGAPVMIWASTFLFVRATTEEGTASGNIDIRILAANIVVYQADNLVSVSVRTDDSSASDRNTTTPAVIVTLPPGAISVQFQQRGSSLSPSLPDEGATGSASNRSILALELKR